MKRPRSFDEAELELELELKSEKRPRRQPTRWTSAWLDLDRPGLEPTRTYPIDEKFLRETLDSKECQGNPQCKFISHNIRHVSFGQFVDALDRTVDKLIASKALDEPFALAPVEDSPCKSGLWVMELILDKTRIGTDPRFHPALVAQPGEDFEDFQDRVLGAGITTMVIVDDASYSGSQAAFKAQKISPFINLKSVEFVLPFVTERALDVIPSNSPIGRDKTRIWFDQVMPTSREGGIANSQRAAWYFDHKMGDYVSVFPRLRHWISGCDSRKMCPTPPYKYSKSCPRHRQMAEMGWERDSAIDKEWGRQEQLKYLDSL